MKSLVKTNQEVRDEGRWDLDYHLPPEGILIYPQNRLIPVSTLADVSTMTYDPSQRPDDSFLYVDISSVDVSSGTIANPQELTGAEAPSRARMLIRAFDVIVSTCRPTRGAIAVVPAELDSQVCSTGFCVLRCKRGVNPFYLQFVLRAPSTLEQFRKFSTGSSYPAILAADVLATRVPNASPDEQNAIAKCIVAALKERELLLLQAKQKIDSASEAALGLLCQQMGSPISLSCPTDLTDVATLAEIDAVRPQRSPSTLRLL